jgi:hypothetical protein
MRKSAKKTISENAGKIKCGTPVLVSKPQCHAKINLLSQAIIVKCKSTAK